MLKVQGLESDRLALNPAAPLNMTPSSLFLSFLVCEMGIFNLPPKVVMPIKHLIHTTCLGKCLAHSSAQYIFY